METTLTQDAQGWNWQIRGEAVLDDLARMYDEAHHILAEPANTHVDWTGAEWVHLAFVQILLSLRKGLETSGHGVVFATDANALNAVLRDFKIEDALAS